MNRFFSAALALSFVASLSLAQEGYRLPPQEVVDIIDAAPTPSVSWSPDGEWMLLTEWAAMPSIEELSRRMLRLAGTRIDPAANGPYRTGYATGLSLRSLDEEQALSVPLPAGGRLASSSWSHDSRHFMVTVVTEGGTELWAGTVDAPGRLRRISSRLNTVMGGPSWLPDGGHVLAYEVVAGRAEEPPAPTVPRGPNLRATAGTSPLGTPPSRTISSVSGAQTTNASARASRTVRSLADTSTMRARPRSSRCVSSRLPWRTGSSDMGEDPTRWPLPRAAPACPRRPPPT